MNKPAPKEPSMDEILSSIRQIIADDDAAVTTRRPAFQAVNSEGPMTAKPAAVTEAAAPAPLRAPAEPISFDIPGDADEEDESEPLTLSAAQILGEMGEEPAAETASAEADGPDFSVEALLAEVGASEAAPAMPELVDPDDVAFEPEQTETEADAAFVSEAEQAAPAETEDFRMEDVMPQSSAALETPAFDIPSFDAPSAPAAASLPDPTLSADLANQLLEPTTEAVVRSSFSRLNPLPLGNQGVTVESMMREMLRPMLKEWLDENLPTIVERMVEKEIARVARGVE